MCLMTERKILQTSTKQNVELSVCSLLQKKKESVLGPGLKQCCCALIMIDEDKGTKTRWPWRVGSTIDWSLGIEGNPYVTSNI